MQLASEGYPYGLDFFRQTLLGSCMEREVPPERVVSRQSRNSDLHLRETAQDLEWLAAFKGPHSGLEM